MLYIGVDLSDRFFDSCITNSYGSVLSRNRFDFDHDGFCSFIRLIQEHQTDTQESIIGLENPRSQLVDFLTQRGYTVVLTNPNAISTPGSFNVPKTSVNSSPASGGLLNVTPISVVKEGIQELPPGGNGEMEKRTYNKTDIIFIIIPFKFN